MTKDHQRRIQILTLSPFSIRETMTFFGATKHMVKLARKAKKKRWHTYNGLSILQRKETKRRGQKEGDGLL